MSTALAIGAVSQALRNFIDNGFVQANLAGAVGAAVTVSAIAPDLIDREAANEPPRLNLFLVQALPNANLINQAMPWHDAQGRRASNPPLALNLHYLMTAYARSDAVAEMLLGSAMHLLHETPRLTAALLRTLLDPAALPPTLLALAGTRLDEQAELLRITPMAQSLDEAAKLWSALQSPYRPSASYEVSAVIIESERATLNPLPVLTRGTLDPATGRDRGVVVQADLLPPLPTLFAAAPLLTRQSVARLGDTVRVSGVRLNGAGATALLTHRLQPVALEFAVTPNDAGTQFDLILPNDAAAQTDFIPGVWQLSLRVTPPGQANPRQSNGVALLLCADPVLVGSGPPLNLPAATAVRGGAPPRITVQMRTRPQVRPEQSAELLLDSTASAAAPRSTAASALEFGFPNSVPAGNRWVRLRVDGVESLLVQKSGSAPVFDTSQQLNLP
jgi:Pvc16 N-terminal domain